MKKFPQAIGWGNFHVAVTWDLKTFRPQSGHEKSLEFKDFGYLK
ncbi:MULTISPECIES: hypothetical protein [Arthrobacter]|nr:MULTISPECIES: hypothetical protein [Arthrobacter]